MKKVKSPNTFVKILRRMKPFAIPLSVAVTLMVTQVLLRLFGTRMLEDVLKNVFDFEEVSRLGTRVLIIFATGFFIDVVANILYVICIQKIVFRLRGDLSKKINRIPLSYYEKNQTGDVMSRVTNDMATLDQTMSQSLPTFTYVVPMLLGSAIFMFTMNWILALIVIGGALLGFVFIGVVMAFAQKWFVMAQKDLGEANAFIEENYSGHTVIKVSNATERSRRAFGGINHRLYKSEWKSNFFGGIAMPIMMFVGAMITVFMVIAGGALSLDGRLVWATVAATMIFASMFINAIADAAESAAGAGRMIAAAKRVFEFLEEPELEDESHITTRLENPKGNVEFKDVRFGYDDKEVIKGFNLNVKAGSKVAIVGHTGAGKTTMVNLLMKFYKVTSGDIKIDGVSINDITRENVGDLFGMVLQDTWIFNGTVRENLLYNLDIKNQDPTATIESVCIATGIDHYIKTLPKGLDTVLDEKLKISDGQRQLLTIARAMIKNAPLLILDEATSQVDTRTELLIQNALDKLMKKRTSFIIAHRLSTITGADIIIVMENGEIVETGTHATLLKASGKYAELYNSQFA
ncbi:MAG: ABC transporter ATP-binding protein/permease [Firmicutes bacterium]|nr:ABC transporter ATP-binding protein/permease [Bacillota bacterium]